ncbi:heterokaryon incompatibility protein-domain-containing protein [Tricladium varicosporioides]|nr:heterokaryon incompatibility protein-domain-containing protein [Hymenoscyphus varicosporioides]
MAPYIHSPLCNPRSIRVIHLEDADEETAPLQCKLVEVSLDSQPVYKALSYSWDAQIPSHPIECGGDTLYITANCVSALQKIRKIESRPVIWIDSICIDQKSEKERDQQVALMGDIYKQASDVIVWLGKEDESSRKALQCIEDIALMPISEERRARALKIVMGIDIKKESDDPIGPLFTRSWFSRMWTIQEATLPPGERVWILCGEVRLPWQYLTIAVGMLNASQYRWGTWRSAMQLQTHLSDLVREMKERESGSSVERPSLVKILEFARGKAATNPRDKVFALFGILQELNIASPSPAYGKPLGRIYAETTVACINNDESLKILYYVPSDNRHLELPSWAVDWSDRGWEKDDSRSLVTEKPFCASGSSTPGWCFREDALHLVLRGKIVDLVEYLGQPLRVGVHDHSAITPDLIWSSFRMEPRSQWSLQDTIQDMDSAFKILKSWVDLASRAGSEWVSDVRQTALRATLLEGHSSDQDENSDDMVSSFLAWCEMMKTFNPKLAQGEEAIRPGTVPQSFTAVTSGLGSKYHYKVMRTCSKKSFIVTRNSIFGIAPDMVKVDDSIALVAGLGMPVILRPAGQDTYRLICQAYVYGIMDGEAWKESGCDIIDIVLT